MTFSLDELNVANGDRVSAEHIRAALSSARLDYGDGAVQDFHQNGETTYLENGRPTQGEWYVDDNGRFCSFWPPSYRACYDLYWVVDDGRVVGVQFAEHPRGSTFEGRFDPAVA